MSESNPAPSRQELSKQLRDALNDNEVYWIIDRNRKLRGSTPLAGACWPVASAIQKWLGAGQLVTVIDLLGQVHHVAVEHQGLYYDAEGISTKSALLRRWKTREGIYGAKVAPMPPLAPGLVCPVGTVREFRDWLDLRLGDSAPYRLLTPKKLKNKLLRLW